MQILSLHEQFEVGRRSMYMQLPRPPSFAGQIDQTTKAIGHGWCAGFDNHQRAARQEILRSPVDLVGKEAGSQVKLSHARTDEMVVPERQPLRSHRLTSIVLHVDAAGQRFAGVEVKNSQTNFCAVCGAKTCASQNRKQKISPKHVLQ